MNEEAPPSGMYPTGGMAMSRRTPSGGTAETLILIGLILQAIITLWGIVSIFVLSSFTFFAFGGLLLLAIGVPYALLALFFLYAAYEWVYRRTKATNYEGARTWTLVLGILGLPFGYLIVGILYIIAYVKLGDAINEQRQMAMTPPGGMAPMAAAPVYTSAPVAVPAAPGAPMPPAAAAPGPAPTCPRCGQPATWIAQYNRYYCYRDQQYI
jgi:hypothetical protein